MKKIIAFVVCIICCTTAFAQQAKTYAEKLGWPKGARVLILHVDDAGMSHESNDGVEAAIEKGVATSTSVMMPCPWVPEFVKYLDKHPGTEQRAAIAATSIFRPRLH